MLGKNYSADILSDTEAYPVSNLNDIFYRHSTPAKKNLEKAELIE